VEDFVTLAQQRLHLRHRCQYYIIYLFICLFICSFICLSVYLLFYSFVLYQNLNFFRNPQVISRRISVLFCESRVREQKIFRKHLLTLRKVSKVNVTACMHLEMNT